MQIVKFEDLPYASLVHCHLEHLVITDRTCCTYGVIAMISLWTDETNERAGLCTSRVPTRAEAPRNLTLYDSSVPRQYRHGTNAMTHHLL